MEATMSREQMLALACEPARVRVSRRIRAAALWASRHRHTIAAVLAVSIIAVMAFTPVSAHAEESGGIIGGVVDFFTNPIEAINDWFCGMFADLVESIFAFANGLLGAISPTSALTATWNAIFADDGGQFAKVTRDVANNVIQPCAKTILAIVILMQLFKIASEMDRNGGTLPGVREVFKLFVFCAVSWFCVSNAFDIMRDLYELIRLITGSAYNELAYGSGSFGSPINIEDPGSIGLGGLAMMAILGLFHLLVALLVAIISHAVVLGRSLEIYLFAMFAPLPMAMFGFEETKSWAVGYVKNFVAVCLSGVIIMVLLWLFPIVLDSMLGDKEWQSDLIWVVTGGALGDQGLTALVTFIKILATDFILALMMFNSGNLAQRILGGA